MIKQFLQDYEAKRQKILNNKDWTPTGRQKAMAKLDREKKEAARGLIHELRKSAIVTAAALKETQDTKEGLFKEAVENMDYNRLNYAAQTVRSTIDGADSFYEIQAAWDQDQEKADPYVIKAWKETAAGPLAARGEGGITQPKAKLIQSIAKAEVKLIDDQDIIEIEREAVETLQDIKESAFTLGQEFNKEHIITKRVMSGIRFSKGRIELGFEPKVIAKFEDDYEVMETHKQLAQRVEKEYLETAQESVTWAKEKFDVELDPDFDDLST